MDASIDENGEFIFTKQVMADEKSEIHYKFRHPSGDWWELDSEADTGEFGDLESENAYQNSLYFY
jgi:hypothetical protein